MSATLLQVLDVTIVNVALPTIQGNLGANFDESAWVVTAYIIAAVIVIPLTPWLQQLFGRRNYYVAAIIGFTIASVLCGLSTSLSELIFFRILQGLFGGGFDFNRTGYHARHVSRTTAWVESSAHFNRSGCRTAIGPPSRRAYRRIQLELDLLREHHSGNRGGRDLLDALARPQRQDGLG